MKNQDLVIVVGVGPGVGLAVANAFAKKGHPLLLISRSLEKLEGLAKGLRDSGATVSIASADASNPNEVARAITQVKGPISALVYNAAGFGGPLLATEPETLKIATEVNLYSLLSATKAALLGLEAGSGVVLVTGGGYALYPSSQYGVLSLGKTMARSAAFLLAQELKPLGIRVGTVTIAGIVDPNTAFSPEKIAESYIQIFDNPDSETEILFQG